MPDYDFTQLSPHDFEQLSRDLIQERDGLTLESFKTGRDGGIDFRYAKGKEKLIVQCKHYAGTGWDGLFRDLKKEAQKAATLAPSRYILVTSVGLSPQNKASVQVLFGDALAAGDILGRDDINNLLGLHSAIEEKHYKLWLASRAVLDRVTHNAAVVQSEFEVERVHRDIMRYVQSDAYPRARKMLAEDHVAIISGPPGVGKTSLAKMLLYAYINKGFEAVSILTDFQTGREMYQRGKKQIFYFDDFIGATFLGERSSAFTRNEDRAILDFIELVKGSPTTRLVMTTREHILMQAIAASEKLKHSNLIDSRCVLEIRDYSVGQRAQILYNHICFSDLPGEYRAALLSNRFYQEIVKNKKFNPRLVEWLSTFRRIQSVEPDYYQDFVRKLLADPSEIWRHAYEHQISEAGRSVLLSLYTYSGKCGSDLLERAFQSLQSLRAQRYGFRTSPSDWRSASAELNGSFIRPGKQIEVIDPSVLDMLNAVVRLDMPNSLDMIEGAVRFEQARRVWNFARAEAVQVFGYLTAESNRVAASFERLLSAPSEMIVNGGGTYFDDSVEIRVGTLLEVAEAIRSERLSTLAVVYLDNLLTQWETTHFEIGDGIALLSKVGASKLQFDQSKDVLRKRIISALVYEAYTGCRSDELRDLLSAVEAKELDPEQTDMLHQAAELYKRDRFSADLNSCGSESELSNLEEDLEVIGARTKVNLEGQIHAVTQARDELEENQAAHDEQRFDEWKENRYDLQTADRAIDDLFDSLRNVG